MDTLPRANMEKVAQVQHKIRSDALQQQEYMQGISQWEKEMAKRDREIQKEKRLESKSKPIRSNLRVSVSESKSIVQEERSAARHVYDKGYGKWENFNVDAALAEIDVDTSIKSVESTMTLPKDHSVERRDECRNTVQPPLDAEAAQRELGNTLYAKGDYQAAIRSYTICLGLKNNNVTAFSNRAMAYLKLKQFHNAEADCTSALSIDPSHFKSLQRRASARDALGKHRAALLDIQRAFMTHPSSKILKQQQASVRQHLTSCIQSAPFQSVSLSYTSSS